MVNKGDTVYSLSFLLPSLENPKASVSIFKKVLTVTAAGKSTFTAGGKRHNQSEIGQFTPSDFKHGNRIVLVSENEIPKAIEAIKAKIQVVNTSLASKAKKLADAHAENQTSFTVDIKEGDNA